MATIFMQVGPKILDLLSEQRQTERLWESACYTELLSIIQVINECVTVCNVRVMNLLERNASPRRPYC